VPATSGKQYRFMAAAANGMKSLGGPPEAVAKEFVDKTPKDKRSLWAKKKKGLFGK
jgi:hypothetical protein